MAVRALRVALLSSIVFASPSATSTPKLPPQCTAIGTTVECTVKSVDDTLVAALAIDPTASVRLVFGAGATNADLATVTKLPKVTWMTIDSKTIDDLTPLAKLSSLTDLTVGSPGVKSIAPLASVTSLRTIDLLGSSVSDVAPLASCKGLRTLFLGPKVRDLTPIAGFSALKSLRVEVDPLDAKPLAAMTTLEAFFARDVSWKDVGVLSTMTSLKSLALPNAKQVVDLSGLAKLASLGSLALPGAEKLADVSVVAGMPALRELFLAHTAVTSIAPVAKLVKLERVDLTGTKVKDLRPLLASAKSLQQLLPPDSATLDDLEPFRKANPKIWFHDTY